MTELRESEKASMKLTKKQALVLAELEGGAVLHSPNYVFSSTGFLRSASEEWGTRTDRARRVTDEVKRAIRPLLCAIRYPGTTTCSVVFVHPSTVAARLESGWLKAHHTDLDIRRTQ